MIRKYIFGLIAIWTLMFSAAAESQVPKRVGVLVAYDQFIPAFEGFKKKMADLGYIEGKNIVYDFNNANGDSARLEALAEKIAQEKPDLVVAASARAVASIAKATRGTNIPVVFLSVADPSRFEKADGGLGKNFTGVSVSTIDLTEKRIELLKELVPGIKKAISLHHTRGPNYEANLRATRAAAKRLALNLSEVTVGSPEELIQRAPVLLTRKAGEAIMLPPDPIVAATQKTIVPYVIKQRLPSIAGSVAAVHAGALATYAADYFAVGEQGAMLADNILKGAKPSDLPIQQPFKLKLIVNLKTAKSISLKVPREILVRADEVIE